MHTLAVSRRSAFTPVGSADGFVPRTSVAPTKPSAIIGKSTKSRPTATDSKSEQTVHSVQLNEMPLYSWLNCMAYRQHVYAHCNRPSAEARVSSAAAAAATNGNNRASFPAASDLLKYKKRLTAESQTQQAQWGRLAQMMCYLGTVRTGAKMVWVLTAVLFRSCDRDRKLFSIHLRVCGTLTCTFSSAVLDLNDCVFHRHAYAGGQGKMPQFLDWSATNEKLGATYLAALLLSSKVWRFDRDRSQSLNIS